MVQIEMKGSLAVLHDTWRSSLLVTYITSVLMVAMAGNYDVMATTPSASVSAQIRLDVGSKTVEVPSWFRGFTSDWWRHNENSAHSDNGMKWGKAGLLTLNLQSPILYHLTQELSPAVWRIGGTPQDEVVYVVGNPPECNTEEKIQASVNAPGPLCLTMTRWKEILSFAAECRLQLVFGLNGMYGRNDSNQPFNITNTLEFLRYTSRLDTSDVIFAFELSNEKLRQRNGASPAALAGDFIRVKEVISKFWAHDGRRPLLLGPDSSERHVLNTKEFISHAAGAIDGLTYHSYCVVYSTCDSAMFQLARLNRCLQSSQVFQSLSSGYGIPVWAGESGPLHRGGAANCSDRFVDSYWYLHHLGSLSRQGIEVFARSTLVGAYYGLLDKATLKPRPDYFAALLWGRLMQSYHFLRLSVSSAENNDLFAFASRSSEQVVDKVDLSLLVVNMDPLKSVDIDLQLSGLAADVHQQQLRDEYHISSDEPFGSITRIKAADSTWTPLELTTKQRLPDIRPVSVATASTLNLAPASYVFVTWSSMKADSSLSWGSIFITWNRVLLGIVSVPVFAFLLLRRRYIRWLGRPC